MNDKIRLLLILILSLVLTQVFSQDSFFEINNKEDSDTLKISIYTEYPSREFFTEQIFIVKHNSEYKAIIKSNFVMNMDTIFILNNKHIDRIRKYQLNVINGDIQQNFRTGHRLALKHKIENSDLTITRQTYIGQEFSLAYLLTRIE